MKKQAFIRRYQSQQYFPNDPQLRALYPGRYELSQIVMPNTSGRFDHEMNIDKDMDPHNPQTIAREVTKPDGKKEWVHPDFRIPEPYDPSLNENMLVAGLHVVAGEEDEGLYDFIPSFDPDHYFMPPIPITHPIYTKILEDMDPIMAVKTFQGAQANFGQVLVANETQQEQLTREELENDDYCLKQIFRRILLTEEKNLNLGVFECQLDLISMVMSTFSQIFVEPISELDMRTLILDRTSGKYHHERVDDKLFSGIETNHLKTDDDFIQMLKNFCKNDLIFGRQFDRNKTFDFGSRRVKKSYSLLQTFQHRIVSYDLYMYFLIVFHKILIVASRVQDDMFLIDQKKRLIRENSPFYINWKDVERKAGNPKYLFFKFYPLYLDVIQNLSFEHYKLLIRNNFKQDTSIVIPSETGALMYLTFNVDDKSPLFFLEQENPRSGDILSPEYNEGFDNLIPNRIFGGRQFLKCYNKNLIQLLGHYFLLMKDSWEKLVYVDFQIVFSFFSPFVSTTQTSRSHYVTSSINIPMIDYMRDSKPYAFEDFMNNITQYIFLQIENFLINSLLTYTKLGDSETYEEIMNNVESLKLGVNTTLVLNPEFQHPENLWKNLRIIGWKLTGVKNIEALSEMSNLLSAFHQNNEQFNSWIDIFSPTKASNCLMQIIGNYFVKEEKIQRYNVTEVLMTLKIELSCEDYKKLLKYLDSGRVYKFFQFWNKIYPHKYCLYIWASNSLLFKEYIVQTELTFEICVLYQNNIGIVSLKRYKEMTLYYLNEQLLEIPFYKPKIVDNKKKTNCYSIYPKKKKIQDSLYRADILKEPLLDPASHIALNKYMKKKELWRKTMKNNCNISNNSANVCSVKYIDKCCEISEVSSKYNVIKYSKLYPKSEFTFIENKTRKFLYSKKTKKITKKFFNATSKVKKEKIDEDILLDWPRDCVWGWDCETVLNENNEYVVRCVCVVNLYTKVNKSFFGENCLIDFFSWLRSLDFGYENKQYFYSFNGARFDNILIFVPMLYFFIGSVKFVGTPNNIKIITLMNCLIFYDLRLILTRGSLNKLSEEILGEKKIENFNIMDYVGDILKFDLAKDEIIKYCLQDCCLVVKLVYNLLDFLRDLFNKFQLPMKLKKFSPFQPTISLLTLKVWRYLGDWHGGILKGCSDFKEYECIKESYKGGMCLPIKKRFQWKNSSDGFLYHYDINSSYPYIMERSQIPITIKEHYILKPNEKMVKKYEDYYLYEIRFEFNSNVLIPYIPIRLEKEGGLLYPLSNYGNDQFGKPIPTTYVWGHILSFYPKHFKKIKVYSYIVFNTGNIFQSYITQLWKEREIAKQEKSEVKSMWLKIFMNSLYGKFGQKQFEQTHVLHTTQLHEYLIPFNTNEKNEENKIEDECQQIKRANFVKNISIFSEDIPGEPFFLIKTHDDNRLDFVGSLNFISSYIASRARLNLIAGFLEVGFDNIYYFDTDSIFTSQPITDKRMVGVDLGQWKCEENNIIDAYFLAPKVYAYFTKDGKEDLHCKGIPTKFLKWNDFVQMYEEKYFLYEKIGFLSHKGNKIKLIDDIQKRIEIRDRKRIYDLDNNTSKPFKTINDYYKHINLNN